MKFLLRLIYFSNSFLCIFRKHQTISKLHLNFTKTYQNLKKKNVQSFIFPLFLFCFTAKSQIKRESYILQVTIIICIHSIFLAISLLISCYIIYYIYNFFTFHFFPPNFLKRILSKKKKWSLCLEFSKLYSYAR